MPEKIIFLIDDNGIRYLENLPEGFVQATLDDFHVQGKKKIGMFYLVRGLEWKVYFPREVNERLTGEILLPFIEAGLVFVKK